MSKRPSQPAPTPGPGDPMTPDQAALLRRLADAAFERDAYREHLTQDEAARRIATLQAKLKLQGTPPHTQ